MTKSKQAPSMPELPPAQVSLQSLSSPLTKIYQSHEFQLERDNDVAFHIARNVLRLRRLRGLSQAKVAKEMGTSQSALARIESAQENITLSTLQRLITALKGRFQVSIAPAEMSLERTRAWWHVYDAKTSSTTWGLVWVAARQTDKNKQLVAGWESPLESTGTEKHQLLLQEEGAN